MKTRCSIVQTGLFFSLALTFGTGIEPVAAQPNVSEFQRFADWCENKASLTPKARHNVQPLSALTNLTELWLDDNPLPDRICPVQPASICQF